MPLIRIVTNKRSCNFLKQIANTASCAHRKPFYFFVLMQAVGIFNLEICKMIFEACSLNCLFIKELIFLKITKEVF